jgi:hypothetical protein
MVAPEQPSPPSASSGRRRTRSSGCSTYVFFLIPHPLCPSSPSFCLPLPSAFLLILLSCSLSLDFTELSFFNHRSPRSSLFSLLPGLFPVRLPLPPPSVLTLSPRRIEYSLSPLFLLALPTRSMRRLPFPPPFLPSIPLPLPLTTRRYGRYGYEIVMCFLCSPSSSRETGRGRVKRKRRSKRKEVLQPPFPLAAVFSLSSFILHPSSALTRYSPLHSYASCNVNDVPSPFPFLPLYGLPLPSLSPSFCTRLKPPITPDRRRSHHLLRRQERHRRHQSGRRQRFRRGHFLEPYLRDDRRFATFDLWAVLDR